MTTFAHTWFLTLRLVRHLLRQPWFIAFTLMQPVLWLLLYGQSFQRVSDLPGFHGSSYVTFLTPGIVMMAALFASGWTGLGVIADLDSGIMERLLVSPASRSAIIMSRLFNLALSIILQCLILLGLGWLVGARYSGGLMGVIILLVAAILLGMPFGALSTALALKIRKQESVLGAVNFVLLPLTFMSPAFIAGGLMPAWMQRVAIFNPVGWGVDAGRGALQAETGWPVVLVRLGYLALLTAVSCWLAMKAFRSYQRTA